MTLDISETIVPNSDQVNAEDLIGGPRTVTVTGVEKGTADQPVFVHLAEFPGRTYRPAKSMRRVLLAAWGADASVWAGRHLTIYNDPHVKWGGQEVGGVRISHMSHITEPLTVALTVTRGKRAPFTVQPLTTTAPAVDHVAALTAAASIGELQAAWAVAMKAGASKNPDLIALKDERKAALSQAAD